jgi:1-acyl-sn-glycerol-3-phosphate acyltransferase
MLGDAVPQRGNSISRVACRWLFRLLGWRFEGNLPDVPKAVIIVVPHTSNWDFVIGVVAMFALGVRVSFLAKHTLFWFPLGVVMQWLGGVRVDRSSASGVVEQITGEFSRSRQLVLVVAPEGTRGQVRRWKTGFYRIAKAAGVSIVPASFDYARRIVRFGAPLAPTGDFESDQNRLEEFFVEVTGRRDR